MFFKLLVTLFFVGAVFADDEITDPELKKLLDKAAGELEDEIIGAIDEQYRKSLDLLTSKYHTDVDEVMKARAEEGVSKNKEVLMLEIRFATDKRDLKKSYQEERNKFTHNLFIKNKN